VDQIFISFVGLIIFLNLCYVTLVVQSQSKLMDFGFTLLQLGDGTLINLVTFIG